MMLFEEDDAQLITPFGLRSQALFNSFASPFGGLLQETRTALQPGTHLDPSEFDSFADMEGHSGTHFESSRTVYSCLHDGEGPPRVERSFTHTRGGDGYSETQQTYSNSHTQVEKRAVERRLGSQRRRLVTDHDPTTGEETTRDLLHGLSEEEKADFDSRWASRAQALREGAPQLQGGGRRHLADPAAAENGERAGKPHTQTPAKM